MKKTRMLLIWFNVALKHEEKRFIPAHIVHTRQENGGINSARKHCGAYIPSVCPVPTD